MWRSWLAHLVWDQRVLCSSHSTPTQEENQNGFPLFYYFLPPPFSLLPLLGFFWPLFPDQSFSPPLLLGFFVLRFCLGLLLLASFSVLFFFPPPQSISFFCIRLGRLSSASVLVFCFLPHSQYFSALCPSFFYQFHIWFQKRQRPRRARFCEPAVPHLTRKSPLLSLRRKQSSFLSITCAPNVPQKYF